MANLYDVLDNIIKNDTDVADVDQQAEVVEEPMEEETRNEDADDRDTGYDNGGGFEGAVSNSVGRGAVENLIKNTVYEKYNIDSKAMKEFARLSPTEMLSDLKTSVKELGELRSGYSQGQYTKAEYQAISGK